MKKIYGDVIFGSVFFLFGLLFFISSCEIKETVFATKYGATIAPKLISGSMIVISIVMNFNEIIKLRAMSSDDKSENEKVYTGYKGLIQVAISVLTMVIFLLLFDTIGFIIMTSILLIVQMVILSQYNFKKIPFFAVISIIFAITFYYIFANLLYLKLPTGILSWLEV